MKSYFCCCSLLLAIFFLFTIDTCHGLSCYAGDIGCAGACQNMNCYDSYCSYGTCYCTNCQNSSTVTYTQTVTYYQSYVSRKRQNDPINGVTFKNISIVENGRSFQVCLTAIGDLTDLTIPVRVATISGTATAREDYHELVNNTYLIFNETEKTNKCFDVIIFDDNLLEGSETFTVTLIPPLRAQNEPQLIDMTTLQPLSITIIDDDLSSNAAGGTRLELLKMTIIFAVLFGLVLTVI